VWSTRYAARSGSHAVMAPQGALNVRKVAANVSAHEVWERLLRDEPTFILDVRNRDEFERWRVEGPHRVTMFNIPYYDLLDLEGEDEDVTDAVIRGGAVTAHRDTARGAAHPCRLRRRLDIRLRAGERSRCRRV
jgi:rhodanese-related sulfurtransferase